MKFNKIVLGLLIMTSQFNRVICDVNVVACGSICAGNNVSCRGNVLNCGQTLSDEGGLGDLLNSATDASDRLYDLKNLRNVRTEDLGIVKNDMINFSTTFPAMGQKKMIKFTATTGALAGKQVSLLFVSIDLNASRNPSDMPKALGDAINDFKKENKKNPVRFESMVRIFGQVEGGSPMWFDTGAINLGMKPNAEGFNISMQAMADGAIVITDTELLNQTGADGATARIAPIELDFAKVPEMMSR